MRSRRWGAKGCEHLVISNYGSEQLGVGLDGVAQRGVELVALLVGLLEGGGGTGAEVNPESWTQLKGSHEAQIKFGRETYSD